MSLENVQFVNPRTTVGGAPNQKTFKSPFGIQVNNNTNNPNNNSFNNNDPNYDNSIPINADNRGAPRTTLQNPFQTTKSPTYNEELTGNISLGENKKAPQYNTYATPYNINPNYTAPTTNPDGTIEEPPLLEDLGIDLENIKTKTIAVLTLKKCDEKFLVEADMSGPLLLALAFGGLLLLSGKVHFGYIYGFGGLGCLSLYTVMNLLSQARNIELYNTVSILGYCLLPIVLLAAVNVPLNLKNFFGFFISLAAIGWATVTATKFFEGALHLNEQKWLVAYPIFLFYLVFVLITIF